MGNRAVIELTGNPIGIYLHWSGGRDSIDAFLKAATQLGLTTIKDLAEIINAWAEDEKFAELGKVEDFDQDNWDNGVYEIDHEWNITGRRYNNNPEQTGHDQEELLADVIKAAPDKFKLDNEYQRDMLDKILEQFDPADDSALVSVKVDTESFEGDCIETNRFTLSNAGSIAAMRIFLDKLETKLKEVT